jgi:hypothetical protein
MSEGARLFYCTQCGSAVQSGDRFCGVCGAKVSTAAQDVGSTEELPAPVRERAGGHTLPRFLQFSNPAHDAILGLLLALACAALSVIVIYALLVIRGAFSDPSVPGTIGLALFALMHGGTAFVEVPPVPDLFGLGGSLRLGLPVTTFVLLSFVASLLAARFVARRARTAGLFVLVAALVYALLVAGLAVLGASSSQTGEVTVQFAPDPLSTALRGFLWVGLGTLLGTLASRGTLVPAQPRQVLRGTLWALGVSFAVALILAVVIGLAQQALGTSAQQAPGALTQPTLGSSPVRGPLDTIGALVGLLLPVLGTLWLLAHGVPVGFQNTQDLSGVPLLGEALAGAPLRVALLGYWPWGAAWRLCSWGPW